jgi:hypothetical protein
MIAAILYLLAAVGVVLAARALDRYLAAMQARMHERMQSLAPVDREGSVWVPTDGCYCGALPAGEACDACLVELGLLERPPESYQRLCTTWREEHAGVRRIRAAVLALLGGAS